jgi:hypothetical protein
VLAGFFHQVGVKHISGNGQPLAVILITQVVPVLFSALHHDALFAKNLNTKKRRNEDISSFLCFFVFE